jgi:hypothetical protein
MAKATRKIRLTRPAAGPARGATSVAAYVSKLPDERRRRFMAIRAALLAAAAGAEETLRDAMPAFEMQGRRVTVANRKRYLVVRFSRAELLAGIRSRHPELECGIDSVRIRDTQHVPVYELGVAFERAFAPARTPHASGSQPPDDAVKYRHG